MTQIKLRRDTSANFTSANPVLGVGEPAYETDTKKLKIGDGTTAYTQLEYFSAGGGGSTNVTATLPLKIVDGVISLEVDGQTIQVVDGKLHANLDDKQDKFETQVPLSISSSSITTSVDAAITETTESWIGGGPDKLVYVNVSALNVNANSDWKIHLSGYMGNYHAASTNTNVLLISAEKNLIFRIWFGSTDFRLGNVTSIFKHIPGPNRDFFYEIVHQKNDTKFTFNGTDLVDSSPLSISEMSRALGSGTYTTLAGQGKLERISFLINSDQFQRIDKDISKSYFEVDGVKYPITSVEGTNTLSLNIGSGLSVVDGKLTASSTAPTNMVTTDTNQDITGTKTFKGPIKVTHSGYTRTLADVNTNGGVPYLYLGEPTSRMYLQASKPINRMNSGGIEYSIIDTENISSHVDGSTITWDVSTSKLSAVGGGGSAPSNMVTTDTAQTITGLKTFGGTDLSKILLEGNKSLIGFRQNIDSLPTTLIGGFFDSNGKKSITIGSTDHETLSLNAKSVQDGSGNKFLTSGDKETIMGYIMPDYSTRTEVPWDTDNTAPTDGYVEVMGEGDGRTSAFLLEYTINGVKTAVSGCYATAANTNFRLPVICPKGTVYRASKGAVMHELHFISMKGAV